MNKRKSDISNTYCGSLAYASPEVLKPESYNPKISDLWSLGVLIFVFHSKSLPFKHSCIKTMYESQIKGDWKFKSQIKNQLSSKLLNLVPQLLEPDVQKRLTIEQVLQSEWFAMDSRLTGKRKILQISRYNKLI